MEIPWSCVIGEMNEAYASIPRGGPIYVSDMVGPLTGVAEFESSVVDELQDLEADVWCDSVEMHGDDISVDELKIIEEELVDKAFQIAFKDTEAMKNSSRVLDENLDAGEIREVAEGRISGAGVSHLERSKGGVGAGHSNSPSNRSSRGTVGNQELSKSISKKRKRTHSSLKDDIIEGSCIAMVQGLARIKQKQYEDKAAARLHSFNGSSKIRECVSMPSRKHDSVSPLKSTSSKHVLLITPFKSMDNLAGDKSRRARRKEARLEKNKKKFDSWIHHHQSRTFNKSSDPQSKDVKRCQKKTVADSCNGTDGNLEKPTMVENPEIQLETLGHNDLNALGAGVKREKGLSRKSKNRFEKYLQENVISENELMVKDKNIQGMTDTKDILDEGIPSSRGSLEREQTVEDGEASRKTDSSVKKRKKRKSSEDKPMGNYVTSVSTVSKKNKTKSEEYIEMDVMGDGAFAADDIALERKLAKKLKVKGGKLRTNDGLDMLFEGIPSVIDFLETGKGAPSTIKSSSVHKERRKKSSEPETDGEMEGNDAVGVSEPTVSVGMDMESEKDPTEVHVIGGNAKYVPPQRRSLSRNESEEHFQIRKRIRGILNKLSESNIEATSKEMSMIFDSVGRSIGAQIVSEEVLSSCSRGPRGSEQYAVVFAALIAGMACLVGMDFGAKLLASLAKNFEDEYLKEDNLSLRNLTLLLSYLYIFGVCSSDLIYDFMIMLSKRLMEVDVSTVLTTLQCCGMKLRSDDLKNFILTVQNRVTELKADSGNGQDRMRSKRMEFMLETICDIKNNKRRPKEDTPQHIRIKKWLQKLNVDSILIRGLKWSKLLDPDKKGQWWLFGDVTSTKDDTEEVARKIDREVPEAQKMLQLAAAQRMNTDARRAIFCIIMSVEDYVDAFEKLLRADLHGKQDREIMRVLVECCLQEKVFNKYYCVLASKLCGHDKNHKFTLQYCVWDHFKELESMPLIRSMHLSKFVAEMLASFSLSLTVLKVVDLNDATQLTSKKIMHFRMLFEAIFEYSDKVVWNIFSRIAGMPECETLGDGIKFFVSNYVLSGQKSLAGKFKVAKKALNNLEGVIL